MKKLTIKCQSCGSKEAQIAYIPQYRGYRGFCFQCQTNWPES